MNTILFFVVLILILFLGLKLNINFCVLGIPAAFLVGAIVLKLSPSTIIGYFPTSLFFNYFISTFFFGFAAENDTLKVVAQSLVYKLRNQRRLMPIIVYLICVVVSALGAAAASTPIIMSAIAFSIAKQLNYNPVLASIAVFCGAVGGSNFPWSANYARYIPQYGEFIGTEAATAGANAAAVWTFIFYTLAFMVAYFVFKGYKVDTSVEVKVEAPQPMNKDQKFTLTVLISFIVLLMVPALVNLFSKNAVTTWMATYLNAQVLMAIGAAVFAFRKIAPVDQVFKKKVPFGMILLFCGMTMYMKLANEMGVLDTLTAILTKGNLPRAVIMAIFCLICGILTMFVDGKAVSAFFIPLMPVFAEAAGVPAATFMIAILLGLGAPGISPFSTGGAMSMLGCPDEEKMSVTSQQFKYAFVVIALVVILGAIGLFSIGL